ncbi:eukaryotic mitochondrial regulator protein-domain-containing protein [Halenospora varia]|nr:eukaryotic mitochondrial regulator protein-domain-containing protein [Halenospora varia]
MPPRLRCPTSLPSSACTKQLCKTARSSRSFSTTQPQEQRATRARRFFFRWLGQQGENFRNPLPGSTNYLGAYNAEGQLKRVIEAEERRSPSRNNPDGRHEEASADGAKGKEKDNLPEERDSDRMPFPLNRAFVSQPVLSEEMREEIWSRIMTQGKTVREVSIELSVEMSRVGAVVRLKELEKSWERIGKPLAKPYAEAVMSMLPKTDYEPDPKKREKHHIHESINDLPIHASTGQQIFQPTSESRQFTRWDAAKVFNENLRPADLRIPHPEMVKQHRERLAGLTLEEREEKAQARAAKEEAREERDAARQARKEAAVKRVETPRWEFRFTEINVDDAGRDGRGHKGVGWRYGAPLYDRTRGQIKIPQNSE